VLRATPAWHDGVASLRISDVRGDLPSGTVTFLFTDIEGSTRLLYDLGEERYGAALDEHRGLLRAAFASYGGVEIDTQGDAFFVAFPTAPGALAAAAEAQRGLADGRIRVRMGLHTGTPRLTTEGYIGVDVHRAARIAAAGHGGQVLVSSSTAALVGVELRDLGEHRLKDLAAPERIYQLSDEGFAPLKSLGRSNLPVPATPFVGRVRELVEAGELLGRTRLLTLTGPGGTGKTRLALQLAAEASDRHPDGVFWVPLASLADPALVLETVGRAVGAQRGPAAHIRDGSMLLLLDNYEHLMDASVDLADLLAECPNLRLLVTSRELLRLSGEQAYPVPPLAPADGTQLFLARAWAADPHFAPDGAVDELCARLDQLPLALELAAARVRVLSTSQLVDRLSQRLDLLKAGRAADPRQQTLRATIEWSHDLLDAEEQRLFARLAVFCGGCTLESAEDACAADLDVLQSLVDKSLVRERAGDRFWMLETIREFALERLEASGEAEAVRGRHAEHYIALAEAEEETVLSVAPTPALERLEQEHDNVRAALDWLEQVGRVEDALRLASAIWEFWCLHVHADEGARRFERLLALDERPTLARAKALTGVAHLLRHAVRPGLDRRTLAAAALELHRLVGDPRGIAYAEQEVALVRLVQGDAAAALPLFEENARQLWKLGDEHHALQALVFAADCCEAIGDLDRAQAIAEELLEGARAAGDGQSESSALIALSRLAAGRGRFAEGAALVGEAFRIVEARGLRMRVVPTLVRLARLLVDAGRAEVATCVLGCIEAVREESGAENSEVARSAMEPALQAVRAALGEEAFAEAWTRGLALTPQDAVALAVAEVGGAPT
jgi:predicted ATPase/class 3 adenylate cyclase